jgi:hypothetical protein
MNEKTTEVKTAGLLRDALVKLNQNELMENQKRIKQFITNFNNLNKEADRLDIALSKNWNKAAENICGGIDRIFTELEYSLRTSKDTLLPENMQIPSLRTLTGELRQLEADLGGYGVNRQENTISTTTESITLEGIPLGAFQIILYIDSISKLHSRMCYEVKALDPNPAAKDSAVTHPHVSNNHLCEGDGAVSIKKALAQGRLTDFFSMVENILKVYNPDSPFVALDEWSGEACYDCGYIMAEDQCYYCEFCDRHFCDQCVIYCRCCEQFTACYECSKECNSCGETVCPDCQIQCIDCGEIVCRGCIENDLCPDCLSERKLENAKQQTK